MKRILPLLAILFAFTANAQNVGIGTNAPTTKLDITGGLSLREGPVLTLANGANDNIVLPDITTGTKAGFYRIAGPTAAFSLLGIVPVSAADGQLVTLVNTTTQIMTVKNNAAATVTNGFTTLTGADIVSIAGKSSVTVQYNKTDSRWYVISSQNFTLPASVLSTKDIVPGTGSAVTVTNGANQVVGGGNVVVDVATNALNQKGVVPAPTGINASQAYLTDGSGNPAWGKVPNANLANSTVGVTAGNGISISGSPAALGSAVTVTNSAPDQTVVLNNGTGISVTGTYPNFTIANTSPSSGGTVTNVATGTGLTGGPITTTGTISLANTAVAPGTYGSGTQVGTFTVDAQGRVTSAGNATITGASPTGAAGGELSGSYPNPSLSTIGTTGTYNVVTFDSKGRETSGALRTLTGTTNQIDVTNGNFSANPVIGINPSYTADLKANNNMSGGGTISYSTGYALSWSTRFIVISNGSGSHFSTNGYFDINMPANGAVITGVGGSSGVTVSGGSIVIPPWQALYYVLPVGSTNASSDANYRLASYTSAMQVPENWVLIAVRNGDDNSIRLGNGMTFTPGQSSSPGAGTYINNQATPTQSANFNISGNGTLGGNLSAAGVVTAGASAVMGTGISGGYYQDVTNGAYRAIVPSTTTAGYYFQTNAGATTTMYVGLGGTTNGNVGIGTNAPTVPLHVTASPSGWQTQLHNSYGGSAASYVYFAHGGGYGAHIRSYTVNDGIYVLQLFNNTGAVAEFFASGRTLLGEAGNVGVGTATPATKLDVNYSGTINTTTPGQALYNLHLSPASLTPDLAMGITFGSTNSASQPQAGIYVQSSGSYGTKMYFGTTDAYVTGSKTRMMIDHVGNVGIGTVAPVAKLQVRSGRTYLNQLGNDPSSAYTNADLVLGDDVTSRGYGTANGTNLMLQSVDKSSITALDQGNDLGQISYQGLKWTIGEDVGWGAQNVRMPKLGAGTVRSDASGNLSSSAISAAEISALGFIPNNGIGDWQIASSSTSTAYNLASLELRESNMSGATGTPPHLGLHWGGVVASNITIENSGRIAIRDNPGSGYENLVARDITSTGNVYAGSYAIMGSNISAGYYQDATNGAYRSISASSVTNGYYFQTNNGASTTMYIGLGGSYNGNVGIGTNAPVYKLDVSEGRSHVTYTRTDQSWGGALQVLEINSGATYLPSIAFHWPGNYASQLSLLNNGGLAAMSTGGGTNNGVPFYATNFNNWSDINMKKDVVSLGANDYQQYLDSIQQIRSIKYRFKSETEDANTTGAVYRKDLHLGVEAQSLPKEVYSELLNATGTDKNKVNKDGLNFKGYGLADMDGLLVAGVKALDINQKNDKQKLEEMQKRMDELNKLVQVMQQQ